MKAIIKSGVCLAMGWLASSAGAQDIPIKWQAASPKNTPPGVVTKTDTAVRPISLSQPRPLDATGVFLPIVRGQAPDDSKSIQPIPKLDKFEVVGPDEGKQPKKMPEKNGFTPPPPQPAPSPVYGSLGINEEDGCFGSEPAWCGRSRWCGIGHGRGGYFGDACADKPLWWGSAEYLMWWQRSQAVPPLVTSSPAGTATINSGVIGLNSTTIVHEGAANPTRSGGRFTIGRWMPHFCNLGIEANFFFLGRQDNTSIFGGDGNPQFARPIFNVVTQQQGSQLVAINNRDRLLTGTVAVHDYSQVWGLDINLRRRWHCNENFYFDLLAGYRYLYLAEGIEITENLQNFDPATRQAAGNFLVRDSFRTHNRFHGAQIGFDSECRFWNRMFLGLNVKLAAGTVSQTLDINGSTTFTNFPAPFGGTFQGGLLALPGTNIGRHQQTRFAVLPEVGVKLGMDINDHWRIFVGYDFLYLSNVIRPGEQIDLRVNPNFQPSAAGPGAGVGQRVPTVLFRTTDYWAQGLNFGLLYRY